MELLTTVTEAGEEEGGTQATPQSAFLISILSFFPSDLAVIQLSLYGHGTSKLYSFFL